MPDFKDPGEVINYAEELEKRHQARFTQYDADEKLWRLDEYVLEEIAENAKARKDDYPSYTANEPRNYFDVVIASLNRFPLRWRGEQIGGGEGITGDEEEISVHERFATGLWREIDDLRLRCADMPFQHDIAFYHALRGGSAIRPWILGRVPVTPFRAELWDLRECVWEIAQHGPSFFNHHYQARRYDLIQSWDLSTTDADKVKADDDGNVEVYDGWWLDRDWDVWNAVVTTSKFYLKEPTNHTRDRRMDHIPVVLTRAEGAPLRAPPKNKAQEYLPDEWQSIFAANRRMYALYNRIATLYMLVVRSGAIGPYFGKLRAGQKRMSAQEIQSALKPFGFVQDLEDIHAVAPPEIANSVKELWQATLGSIQRGSVPHTVYGQTPFELTGIAISQLQGALDLKLVTQREAMKNAYRVATDEFIQQFIRSRKRKVTLSGVDRRDRPFSDEFSAAKLKTKYHLEPELRIDLPITQQQEANIAAMWQKLGVPLEIIYDQLIHLQDPSAAYERKLAEDSDQEPAVKDMKRVFILTNMATEEPDPERKQLITTMRDFFAARVQTVTGPAQGAPAGPGGGMPPEVLSPEMGGQMQQHLQAFTRGPQQTPGVGAPGRQTVEQRLAGIGMVRGG
jgi:hypothetical protein